MPVTPFHFGPGAVLKAIGGPWFSFSAFALVQAVIDVESVSNILADRHPVHDHLHTMPGALLVAAIVVLARPWFAPALHLVARSLARVEGYPRSLIPAATTPTWTALIVGAACGAVTHVLFDAIIHVDAQPFGAGNPLYVPGSFVMVHLLCLAAGIVGVAGWIARLRVGSST